VEQDAGELAATLEDAAVEALGRAEKNGGPAAVGGWSGADAAAGLACQRSTVVCWDRETGEPLAPALSWQDRRAAAAVAALAAHAARVEAVTGLPLSPHYGAAKIAWCLGRLPRVAAAARHGRLACGPLASWLVFRLTGGRRLAADPANAGRTQLLDLATLDWDPGLLDLFGVPRAVLPDPAPTLHPFGRLVLGGAALTAVTGDQGAALFAGGRPAADLAYLNLGTGAFVQRPLAARPPAAAGMLASVACHDPRPGGLGTVWALEGAVNGAGAAVEAVAAELGIDRPAERLAGWLDAWPDDGDAEPPLFLNGVAGLADA
jgi:glycerol kinase